MSEYASVEEYAESVRRRTSGLLGSLCHRLGPQHPTTLAILDLLTEATEITEQHMMQQEVLAGYDLAALRVDVSVPSDSENPFAEE